MSQRIEKTGDSVAAPPRSSERQMWIDADRIFYAGLLGTPTPRAFGAHAVYVALDGEVSVAIGEGEWQAGELALVPANVTHRVACASPLIGALHLEPETLDPAGLPGWLQGAGGVIDDPELLRSVRQAYADMRGAAPGAELSDLDFDLTMFGQHLPVRRIEPRIAAVVDMIKRDPSGTLSAGACAASVQLSTGRFLHLFTQQVGVPFRSFRSWKRARSLLHHVTRSTQLTDVAMDAGYPDASHFSHTIRQVFGLPPKDIFAGSRRLVVHGRLPRGSGGR